MHSTTLLELINTQNPGLKVLKINRYQHHGEPDEVQPGELESFELKAVDEGEDIELMQWTAWLLANNHKTLKRLCLGAEPSIVRWYYNEHDVGRESIDTTVAWLVEQIMDSEHIWEQDMERFSLSLEVCELKGMPLGRLIAPNFFLFRVSTLTSLSLESCWDFQYAFRILATEKNERGQPLASDLRLQEFRLRYEEFDPEFRAELISFLCSIQGLKHLAILLETDYKAKSIKKVLEKHGGSLQSLVWDERRKRPVNFLPENKLPKHLPIGSFCARIVDIATYCTQLRELGIPADWRIFAGPAVLDAQRV